MPLLRSDEAQADRARAAVPGARHRRRGRRSLSRRDAADRVDPRRRARGGGADRRGGRGARGRARAAARVRALAGRLTRGFLLCAVLDDVTRRRVIKFAYDEPLARPGRAVALLRRAGLHRGGELSRRGRRPGRDARAHDRDDRRPHRARAGRRPARRRPARRSTTSRSRGGIEPGLSVTYGTERGRFLVPAALVAWVIAFGLDAAVAVRRPARAGDLGRPGDRGPALVVRGVQRPRAAARRASARAAGARALPALPGGRDGRRRRRGRVARVPRLRGTLEFTWGSAPLWPSSPPVS